MEAIKAKKGFIFNIVIFYALLSYGYVFFFYIFQNFANKIGFPLDVNYIKMVEGLIVVLLVGLFYVFNDLNESIYLTYTFIFYTFILVPSASFYFLSNNSRPYFYMQVTALVILNLFHLLSKVIFKDRSGSGEGHYKIEHVFKKSSFGKVVFLGILIVFMLADIVLYVKYGHSVLYLFKMDKVYDIRFAARATVPSKLNYVIAWSAMVIIPSSIAWCLKRKKYFLIVIPVIIQVLLFTIGGAKSTIFSLALAAFFFIVFSLKKVEWFIPCLNLLIAGSLILKNAYIMAVVIRRAFFFPQSISYSYFDFFSKYPQLHLSNSILRHFYVNPYKLDIPFIISRYTYKTPSMSANNNYIANAFANYGFLGIIVFTVILAVILVMIEGISRDEANRKYIIFITFCSFFALMNSALFTTMLTHGLLLSVVLGFIFFKAEKSRNIKDRLNNRYDIFVK